MSGFPKKYRNIKGFSFQGREGLGNAGKTGSIKGFAIDRADNREGPDKIGACVGIITGGGRYGILPKGGGIHRTAMTRWTLPWEVRI